MCPCFLSNQAKTCDAVAGQKQRAHSRWGPRSGLKQRRSKYVDRFAFPPHGIQHSTLKGSIGIAFLSC